MNNENIKIKSFTDLDAWKLGHQLALKIYKVTEKFPEKEKYGLTSQIRRSSVSVTSNIAEGFSRRTKNEKVQFYYISLGSLTEVQNQLLLSRDIGFLHQEDFQKIATDTVAVSKCINGLIKSSRHKKYYT